MEKKNNGLSQAIKDKLEGYEKTPPSDIWQKIEAGLDEATTAGNSGKLHFLQKHWQVIAAVAAALLILLFVLSYGSDTGVLQQSPIAPQNKITHNEPVPAFDENQTENVQEVKKAKQQQTEHSAPENKIRTQKNQNTYRSLSLSELHKKDCRALANKSHAANYDYPEKKILSQKQNELSSPQTYDESVSQNQPVYPNPSANNNWAFGVYATPERMFSPGTISGNSSAFSADVAVMYSFSSYFIQSGFSMGTSSDNSNANINFIETEFLGTYQDVYNVTFDTTGNEPKPIYHTQEVEVYDTTEHQTTTAYTNSYRYLSMPLLMGHKNTLSQNLAYSLKGGPVVSFMLNETTNHNFDNQNAQIQNIYNKPAARVTTNWQFVFSAGLHYHLHNDIWLAVEPRVKYYFNPVYNAESGPDSKNPFALGISTGLTVGF
ncbi:MAG: hypothetical protein ACQESX_02770 [Bacteroidota bacterium]